MTMRLIARVLSSLAVVLVALPAAAQGTCADFTACVLQCPVGATGSPDQACVQQCTAQYPTGAQDFQAMTACAQQAGCNLGSPSAGQCIADNCPDEFAACQPAAVPEECPSFVACVGQCPGATTGQPDQACLQQCVAQYPGGGSAYNDFVTCVQDAGCDPNGADFEQCATTNCPDEVAACFGGGGGGGPNPTECPPGMGSQPSCMGDVLAWCDNGTLQQEDCASEGLTCDFDNDVQQYACVDAGGSTGGETDAGSQGGGVGEADAGSTGEGGGDAGAAPGADAGAGLPTGGTTKKDASGSGGLGGLPSGSTDASGGGQELTTGTKDSGGGGCASSAPGRGGLVALFVVLAFGLAEIVRRRRPARA